VSSEAGAVQAHSFKGGRVGVKINDEWYGAWLESRGEATAFSGLADIQDGEYLSLEYSINDRGYRDITKILSRQAGTKAPNKGRDSRQTSIERQNASNVAARVVAAMVEAKVLPREGSDLQAGLAEIQYALDYLSDGRVAWLNQ
jgi:hypothetical protein